MAIDGAEALSKVSGLGRPEVLKIWEEVKLNQARLDACPRHRFDTIQPSFRLGQQIECTSCSGKLSLSAISHYIKGYVAAGKPAADICPNWGMRDETR